MAKKKKQIQEDIIEIKEIEKPEQIVYQKQETLPDWRGKNVIPIIDELEYYNKPSWDKKDVVGVIHYGEKYPIKNKIRVNGRWMFEFEKDKELFYISASNKQIVVIE